MTPTVHTSPQHPDPAAPALAQLVAVRKNGLGILQDIWDRKLTAEHLIADDFPKNEALLMHRAARLFFGPTRQKKLRREHLNRITEQGLSLGCLLAIAEPLTQLTPDPKVAPAHVLDTILERPAGPAHEVKAHATSVVRRANRRIKAAAQQKQREAGEEPTPDRGRFYGGTSVNARGNSCLMLEHTPALAAKIRAVLEAKARAFMRTHPGYSLQEAMAEIAVQRLLATQTEGAHGGPGNSSDTSTTHTGAVTTTVITVEGFKKIMAGTGGTEEFASVDGTTATTSELANRGIYDYRRFAFFTAKGKPVEMFHTRPELLTEEFIAGFASREAALLATIVRMPGKLDTGTSPTARSANDKQRAFAHIMHLQCGWFGCDTPAQLTTIHHVTAWSRGGHTAPDNLALLCKKHNSTNDDDPDRPRNGRVGLIDGVQHYHPPDGSDPLPSTGALADLTAVALARRQAPIPMERVWETILSPPPTG